jgi:hypothetical protein
MKSIFPYLKGPMKISNKLCRHTGKTQSRHFINALIYGMATASGQEALSVIFFGPYQVRFYLFSRTRECGNLFHGFLNQSPLNQNLLDYFHYFVFVFNLVTLSRRALYYKIFITLSVLFIEGRTFCKLALSIVTHICLYLISKF